MWMHREEANTVGVLLQYFRAHPKTRLIIEFASGESYLVSFFTSYDTDNEEAVERHAEQFVEFHEVGLNVEKVIKPGPHYIGGDSFVAVSFRDFPTHITDEEGTVIYTTK